MFVPNLYESFLENEVVAFSVHKHHQSSIVLDLCTQTKSFSNKQDSKSMALTRLNHGLWWITSRLLHEGFNKG